MPYKKTFLYKPLLLMGIINIGILLFFLIGSSLNKALIIIQLLLLWGVVGYLAPLLILFFNYQKVNNKATLEIVDNKFIYRKNKGSISFDISDIDKVILNLSFPLYHRDLRLFFWDEYYYAFIKLKNGEDLVVTCLLCDEIEKLIPKNVIVRKRRFFPLISTPEPETVQDNFSKEYDQRVKSLMVKFESKSQNELKNIIDNKEKFQEAAVEAAKNLLKFSSLVDKL